MYTEDFVNIILEKIKDLEPVSQNDQSVYKYRESNKIDINLSTILTHLIHETGRYCETFASDLFHTWSAADKKIRNINDTEPMTIFFGIRKNGVDNEAMIANTAPYYYRKVYLMTVRYEDDKDYSSYFNIYVKLYDITDFLPNET